MIIEQSVLACAILVSAIFLAIWLASKKNSTVDVIVGILTFLIVSWILLSMIRF